MPSHLFPSREIVSLGDASTMPWSGWRPGKPQQSTTRPGVREREIPTRNLVSKEQTLRTRGSNLRAIPFSSCHRSFWLPWPDLPACLHPELHKLTCCKSCSSYERRKLLRSLCFNKDVSAALASPPFISYLAFIALFCELL